MLDEHVELLERPLVEQQLDALAGGQLAAGMLRLDALLAAAELGAGAPRLQGVQDVLHASFPPYPIFVGRGSNTAFSAAESRFCPTLGMGHSQKGAAKSEA